MHFSYSIPQQLVEYVDERFWLVIGFTFLEKARWHEATIFSRFIQNTVGNLSSFTSFGLQTG